MLVLKLNESEFKPVFTQMYEWGNGIAASTLSDTQGASVSGDLQFLDPHGLWRRSVLFYRIVNELAEKLKAIFVPFYRNILDGLVKHLGAAVAESQGERRGISKARKRRKSAGAEKQDTQHSGAATAAARVLADQATDAVCKLFLFDSDQEVATESRLLELVEPLASQLESTFNLDVPGYRTRVAETVVPCVSQLAVCGSSYDIWKPLNHALLSRSRSDRSAVRTASLMCVEALFSKLAEEYLVLLPETIPFLAELMEDDDIEVEALVKKLVKRIEDLSGEKLANYL